MKSISQIAKEAAKIAQHNFRSFSTKSIMDKSSKDYEEFKQIRKRAKI